MSDEPWARPIESLAPELRAGRLSPVALAESALERIRRHDAALLSYVHLADHLSV